MLLQIEMQSMGSKTRYSFLCKRWLAEDEDDKETVRELPATGPGVKKPLPGKNGPAGILLASLVRVSFFFCALEKSG